MENWKTAAGFPDYEVSNTGKIRVRNTGEIVKQCQNSYGYNTVALYVDGKGTRKGVHRVVASTFIRLPNEKEQVNHKDGNKTNNSVENLEWVTQSKNLWHSRNVLGNKHFKTSQGDKKCNIRLKLKLLRVSQNMNQELFSSKIGISRPMYALIEKGERDGSLSFWLKLQEAFNIPDEDMFGLMKKE